METGAASAWWLPIPVQVSLRHNKASCLNLSLPPSVMLAPVSACGCPKVSFRNTRDPFTSAAVSGREKAAPCFPYSCPNPSRHRLWREPKLVSSVHPMKKLTVMVVDDEPVVAADTIL